MAQAMGALPGRTEIEGLAKKCCDIGVTMCYTNCVHRTQSNQMFFMRNRSLLHCLVLTAASFLAQPLFGADTTAPTIDRLLPTAGATVGALTEIEVLFSEDVQGVNPSDLLINGVPATSLFFGVPGQVVFEFPQPATGAVSVAWASGHGITDLSGNAFVPGSAWSYTLNPNAAFLQVRLNEFMADNQSGIRDEDGTHQDWIEIYNAAAVEVDLSGWYLTDNGANLTGWRFPAGAQMAPNSYLLVWASGKDRTNNISALHTNFKLGKDGGYLALVLPDGLTVVSSFAPYPAQRPDASFGRSRLRRAVSR